MSHLTWDLLKWGPCPRPFFQDALPRFFSHSLSGPLEYKAKIQGFGFLNDNPPPPTGTPVGTPQQIPPMAWPQPGRGSEGYQVISETPRGQGGGSGSDNPPDPLSGWGVWGIDYSSRPPPPPQYSPSWGQCLSTGAEKWGRVQDGEGRGRRDTELLVTCCSSVAMTTARGWGHPDRRLQETCWF